MNPIHQYAQMHACACRWHEVARRASETSAFLMAGWEFVARADGTLAKVEGDGSITWWLYREWRP